MKERNKLDFAFTKKNYLLLLVGVVLICAGLLLMIGGGSDDPNVWNPEVIDISLTSQRLTIAPILIAVGFIVEIFAIMHKPKGE
jgi:hypothetical protein